MTEKHIKNRASDPTKQAYAFLLGQCNGPRCLSLGRQLHSQIAKDGQDVFLCNLLIQMYGRCGSVDEAHLLFQKMPHRNVFTWNILIAAFAGSGNLDDARNLFEGMPERDSVSWNTMISAYALLGHLESAKKFFDRMPEPNVVSWNSLVTAYFQNGEIEESKRIFDSMLERNMVSWNCMLTAYVQEGDHSGAECLFDRMPEYNITSWNLMLSAYSSGGMVDWARSLFDRIPEWNLVSWNIMVGAYALNGHLLEARKIFDRMKERSVATWNLMIKAYVASDQGYEALRLYCAMDLVADEITFTSLLDACASVTDRPQGKVLHGEVARRGLLSDSIVANAVIEMYCCCGDLDVAAAIFAAMPERTIVSWTELVAALAKIGHSDGAKGFFRAMALEGFIPGEKTFVSILSACSHGGLLEDGILFFLAMIDDYAMAPRENHYACVVDLLARAGQLSRAEDLVRGMPMIHREGIQWKTLLGACRIHGESVLAARAAKKVLDLDARTGSSYVLLYGALPGSNIPR
ncbi:pentatricopeptide repeat-containing protein At4g02750 [Selaginella moellendorffii]|uniref:pentatricopeptide repeat-containing protein At4g02750 n=1 Tax=Selaginella moellendorffii TaxID=88036 RepID=UPI000D1CBFC2|nr:pentatricopeptide repeat-containing protein At4g02750 [Selaginella moellendorffii]|eukprot:XP_024538010.1 pentatricopeptide repeat-containing protein At4g02750 [Selaginella moellendorffii]